MAIDVLQKCKTIYRPKNQVLCPICHKYLQTNINPEIISTIDYFPFPHIIVHGNPTHGLIVYIDSDGKVRARESAHSVQVE